jgi:DNA-binding NarL/FixJ family response regulator
LTGELEAGAAALAEAETLGDESPGATYHVDRGRMWLAAARGELAVARALARDAAQASQALVGQPLYEAWTLHDLARLGAPEDAAPRLRALALGVEGDLLPLYAAHVTALVNGDGPALDDAAAWFEALGARLCAAEAARAAARVHREAGRTRAAVVSEQVAARIAAECEGARTPGLGERPPLALLTRREAEIAALAAAGLSNREIAERVVISVRTAETHLRHVYDKLGVAGRASLAQALTIDQPDDDARAARPSSAAEPLASGTRSASSSRA